MILEFVSEGKVKDAIKNCEGSHIQQISYSSYHDAITQICFGCGKVRTSLKEFEVQKANFLSQINIPAFDEAEKEFSQDNQIMEQIKQSVALEPKTEVEA